MLGLWMLSEAQMRQNEHYSPLPHSSLGNRTLTRAALSYNDWIRLSAELRRSHALP